MRHWSVKSIWAIVLLVALFTAGMLAAPPVAAQAPYGPTPVPLSCPPPVGCVTYHVPDLEDLVGSVFPRFFDPPLHICVTYPEWVAEANGGAENLTMVYWDPTVNKWVPLDNVTLDTATRQICGDLRAVYDLQCCVALTCKRGPDEPPETGATAASSTGSNPIWLTAVGVAVIAGLAGLRRRNRQAHLPEGQD